MKRYEIEARVIVRLDAETEDEAVDRVESTSNWEDWFVDDVTSISLQAPDDA